MHKDAEIGRENGRETMTNVWDCEYYTRCKNSEKCLSCGPNQRLLSMPEDKMRQMNRSKVKQNAVTAVDDNSGVTLEDYVRDNLNNVPTVREYQARRQAGSGSIWFMPGDVTDPILLTECKERLQFTSKGEKQITITKLMLDKIRDEAKLLSRYPALAFRIKGDDRTYIINEFEVLCEMVHEIKVLRHENEVVEKEKNSWKKAAEDMKIELKRMRAQWEEKETTWE